MWNRVSLSRSLIPFETLCLGFSSIWLVDLARNLPKSAQLDGFDISTAHFPPKQWLPENVNLSVLDALAPVPEHLVGNYDVVHVGRIVLFIQNENPSQLLNNFISLLSKLKRLLLYLQFLEFF